MFFKRSLLPASVIIGLVFTSSALSAPPNSVIGVLNNATQIKPSANPKRTIPPRAKKAKKIVGRTEIQNRKSSSNAAAKSAVTMSTLIEGIGGKPTIDDIVVINYRGWLSNGKEFDKAYGAPIPVSAVIPGMAHALLKMKKKGKYRVFIPSLLAYGSKSSGPIPANSDLYFEIELIDFKSKSEMQSFYNQN
ncbi:FKBP-type peptidyl-prolyl cis-trans isomerase [Novosphingobium arvoryzae]|uniref:FKBP-type peptidyl-prolyl cis-trans isomerase n=1 Tax=Novosphingobium arvoryzae TaxID=1256514 RepID=UPI0016748D8C|nr:FKBP-type peptidyl-prolyl cis-trans isomerase [Novosphingobium arvoryzae]